jgi:uncharacterized protein YneR
LESILSPGGFFVGWVEPTPYFVGFRDTQSNLRFSVLLPKAKPNNSRLESEHQSVSFLIKLADLYLKPKALKAKYQTPQQPNTK